MSKLDELINRYVSLHNEQDKYLNKGSQNQKAKISDEIVSSASYFLNKLNPIAKSVTNKYSGVFKIESDRLYVQGENRTISFTYDNALDIAKEAVKTINETLNIILKEGTDRKSLVRLGVALNTFYQIVDTINVLEEQRFIEIENERKENEKAASEELEKIDSKLKELEEDVVSYYSSRPKNPRSMPMDEALKFFDNHVYSHEIVIGDVLDDSIPLSFINYVHSLGYEVENKGLSLACREGENFAFINASPSFLRRNRDFEDKLKDLIFRSFINFEPKSYQVALIEGNEGEVMLASFTDLISNASLDYIYTGDVADDDKEVMDVINNLKEEIKMRIRAFKSTRTYNCSNIEVYNKHNPDNPFKYIFLVIKDYPDGFMSQDMRNKIENIILDGADTGIMVLIIGENETLEVGYNKTLDPLEVRPGYNIEIGADKQMLVEGRKFLLKEPIYEFDDVEFLKKRFTNASSFSMDTILEDKPLIPHYEEIAIPLGKCGSNPYSLTSHTEKPPYPFVLVTGGTGTGKSAFMHLIILSGAYKYSPDELEFHVIDFKTADTSTEFANYQYGKEMYIPHVKYLSLKSKPENALDIINYIQKLKSKRNKLGKFKEYNYANPQKKMPQIYVIIDEYESMLSGGESNSGNDVESISLQNAIQDGITKILKTARAFGIGVIFSGQAMKGLPKDAFAQLSTLIAFDNRNNRAIFDKLFPGINIDLSLFPNDDYRGLAFTSSSGSTPVMTKFAYAGGPEKMAKFAEVIRNKYPEHTKKHIQSIIGGTASAEVRLDSYLPWKEEIENRLLEAEGDYDDKEQFLSSKLDKVIKTSRPVALGQSSSSELTIYLDYKKDETGRSFFAFGRNENLAIIERNVMLSFLYQIADKHFEDKHIIFMDGSRFGVKDEVFASLSDKYPFIFNQIEYISDKKKMAKTLLKLAKYYKDNSDDSPYLIIMHEIGWFDDKEALPELIKDKIGDKVEEEQNMSDDLKELEEGGMFIPPFLMNANTVGAQEFVDNHEEDEFSDYGKLDIKEAFGELYLNGSLFEHFMLVSSIRYEVLKNEVLGLAKSEQSLRTQLENHSIYGSFEMKVQQDLGDSVNANICYVVNGNNMRSTTRLFDYDADSSLEWWQRLEKMMYIWR